MTKNIKKFLTVLFVLFLNCLFLCAEGAYKNELTKVTLSPVGASDVKVSLFMAKPYTEPLRLLKKNDGEFVLILPETYTSAPQKPSISDVIGEVTDADIKLYSFVSNSVQNGYTKIVIKTNGLVNLYPEAIATGGGTLVNNAQQAHYKIPQQQTYTQKMPTKPSVAATTTKKEVVSKPNVQPQKTVTQSVKQPEQKKETPKVAAKTTTTAPAVTAATQKVLPSKPVQNINVTNIKVESLPVVELPKVLKSSNNLKTDINLEEISLEKDEVVIPVKNQQSSVDEVFPEKEKAPNQILVSLVAMKDKAKIYIVEGLRRIKHSPNSVGNILLGLFILFVLSCTAKFTASIIRSIKSRYEDLSEISVLRFERDEDVSSNEQSEDSQKYSEFFKNLIESEANGDNPFVIGSTVKEDNDLSVPVEPVKTHEEVLNVDQNLTWQEKFRALQKNKKSLLKDEDVDKKAENIISMEFEENMHIENPIKKLKQDFRAVRKVLEKQKEKQGIQNPIEQDFTPEKIEKIEVVSFEDYQKTVAKPKVKMTTSSPIKSKAPKILTQLQLGEQRGLYLIEYKDKIELVGFVKDNVYKLNSYDSLKDSKLYARLTQNVNGTETYIVKFDENKMLIDVDDKEMKLKLMY